MKRKRKKTGNVGIKGKCKLCGRKAYLQKHHIIKKSEWKRSRMVVYLCPKCHLRIHQKEQKDKAL